MRKIIAALIAVPLLASCAGPEDGTVTDRRYTPAWVQVIPPGPSFCSGNPPTCSPGMPMQIINWPDTWELHLKNSTDEGWRTVKESEYDQCEVGKYYPDCGAKR